MEELRDAVRMLAEEAQQVAAEIDAVGDVPSPDQLDAPWWASHSLERLRGTMRRTGANR